MVNISAYVPILQAKAAEIGALTQLPQLNEVLAPMLEVPAIRYDTRKQEYDHPLDTQVQRIAGHLTSAKSWPSTWYLDVPPAPPRGRRSKKPGYDARLADGRHALHSLMTSCRAYGKTPIAVLALDRDRDYVAAVRACAAHDHRGVCLRLNADEVDDTNAIAELLDAVAVTAGDVDVVLDLGAVTDGSITIFADGLTASLQRLAKNSRWRSVTIAGGSFPQSLSGYEDGSHLITRSEYAIWRRICANLPTSLPAPRFGDYGIQAPGQREMNARAAKAMSANVRYTLEHDWLVVRGGNIKEGIGHEEYRDVCKVVRGHEQFCGASFSPGDSAFEACARGHGKPGTPKSWRQHGTSHHLAFVSRQIATSLAGS